MRLLRSCENKELKFRCSIEPLPPAPSSGDGCCDGDACPQREPSPACQWAAEGLQGTVPLGPHGADRGCHCCKRYQIFLHLMNLLNYLLVRITQAEFSGACTWDRPGLSIAVTSQTKLRYPEVWDMKRYPRDISYPKGQKLIHRI